LKVSSAGVLSSGDGVTFFGRPALIRCTVCMGEFNIHTHTQHAIGDPECRAQQLAGACSRRRTSLRLLRLREQPAAC